jgi:hypothetical protein
MLAGNLYKFLEEPTEIKLVFVWDTSDFGAFLQPIKFIVLGSTVVGFGGKTSNDALPWN